MSHSAASVHARLLAKAKSANQDFSLVLTRYGLERMLYSSPATRRLGNAGRPRSDVRCRQNRASMLSQLMSPSGRMSGWRMFAIGAAAGGVTYMVGKLLGVSLG